ncbi:hypothetical protein [Candidimonas nitroreducens]|uniref:hypothetical protein n=1 Tax=Candidimonas nitroreducens TaxID=683354 RepID=UPI001177B1C5|nr:hypothetical protein [Candidimonas nitroreducens]
MLPDDDEDIVFLGGKDYQPLFFEITKKLSARKKVFINSTHPPNAPPGFTFERFDTAQKTNWHYSCARTLITSREPKLPHHSQ